MKVRLVSCYVGKGKSDWLPADACTCSAVESRGGGHGLTISDYTILSVGQQIFRIYRGCSKSFLSVRVCRLS